MKHSRKKRTPPLDLEKLREVSSENSSSSKLRALAPYFLLLERMKDEQSLNPSFISLEALARITTARIEGYAEDDILGSYPDAWGRETIRVPLPLLIALTDAWNSYRSADVGISLGESFGVEGKGQGKSKMKGRLEQRLKEHRIMNAVELAYLASGNTAEEVDAISLVLAIEQVAEVEELSADTVRKYYKKHSKYLRGELKSKGILKG
tara:strand:- start:1234 stop:1857 length:624 start_codon:yes stop_codon:yes gene_type:complete